MSFRLTNSDRDSVLDKAIKFAFSSQEKAIADEEDALGRATYNHIFPEKVRKLASQLPDKWLRMDTCLRISFRGMQCQLKLSSGVRVPSENYSCTRIGDVDDEDLCNRFMKFSSDKEDLQKKKKEAVNTLSSFLHRFQTLKSMREGWPEGVKFYEHLTPRETSSVPAIQVEAMNKMLGLGTP